jgi:hypothetical protein
VDGQHVRRGKAFYGLLIVIVESDYAVTLQFGKERKGRFTSTKVEKA